LKKPAIRTFTVSGRGLLHLGIENMRREGFEMSIGKPTVMKKDEDGKRQPIEYLVVDVLVNMGGVMEIVGNRKATGPHG
jgi:GTP-binding protein